MDGTVLISMSRMDSVEYDESTTLARVGTGVRMYSGYKALEKYGVAIAGGEYYKSQDRDNGRQADWSTQGRMGRPEWVGTWWAAVSASSTTRWASARTWP